MVMFTALSQFVAAIMNSPGPVIAISPIVAGRAIKGPTAKLMREAGIELTATADESTEARLKRMAEAP